MLLNQPQKASGILIGIRSPYKDKQLVWYPENVACSDRNGKR